MNGMLLNDKQIYVGPLLRKQQDMKVEGMPKAMRPAYICQLEGIFPALEASYALAFLDKICPSLLME
ncbi:hypothetical protein LguiA_025351 [Lonicera macranthoides]